jgi:hypothetical protein
MALERSNKVPNLGKIKFTKLIFDVLQLFTLKDLHCAIVKIIKEVTHQKGLVSTEGNQIDLCIRHAINLLVSSINT